MAKKCAISKEQMLKSNPVAADIGGVKLALAPKAFNTGSFGLHGTGKITLMVDNVPVEFQGNVLLTAVGSKPAA